MNAKRIQVDEIWSFTYAKQKNVATAKAAPDGARDTWTWTAIEADTKLIVSYFIGGRDGECAACITQLLGDDRGANCLSLRRQCFGRPAARDGHIDVLSCKRSGERLAYFTRPRIS